MIVNKRSGDSLAIAFSKILNKSLKKQASESSGEMLLENDGSDKYKDENFMKDSNHSSDAEALSNSLDDSMNMLDDPEAKYVEELGGLVDLKEEPMAAGGRPCGEGGCTREGSSGSDPGERWLSADRGPATSAARVHRDRPLQGGDLSGPGAE